jgi:hypothetical protein
MRLSERSLTRSKRCRRCGENLRNMDAVVIVRDDDTIVAAFCHHHKSDPDFLGEVRDEFGIASDSEEDRDFAVQQAAERQWEDYAAYRAAGATSQYWEDRDAGFV